jgi:hypothetical protein
MINKFKFQVILFFAFVSVIIYLNHPVEPLHYFYCIKSTLKNIVHNPVLFHTVSTIYWCFFWREYMAFDITRDQI